MEDGQRRYQIYVNDQASKADDFRTLIVAYRNRAAVRLQDIANVSDGVEDVRNLGMANGKPAILVILYRQPGANIITTVENVKSELPQLQAALPPSVNLIVANDHTETIRASLHDVEATMAIAVTLVMLVVFLFLRNARATLIHALPFPVAIGICVMYCFTLDNLSLWPTVDGFGWWTTPSSFWS